MSEQQTRIAARQNFARPNSDLLFADYSVRSIIPCASESWPVQKEVAARFLFPASCLLKN